ncbi:structural protein [Helicobacter sp. MIT 00-7814]|uniref:phage capsid family protein n=1 Tax=unclassified Helicobacter TaxID=2593540 RepID=UPI000E1EE321|nr:MULTISPECIES: DUF4043 family protein [unclassified Helicobacter]RDU51759.1 structural protein [Helicobacter sp. MIT 00-7814]RDU51770.1 structural protein [Helicobacter sp. MIT 99-10781]
MLEELNKVDILGWKDNPNISVEISRIIEKASWQKSPFEPFLGQGVDRGIRSYNVKNNQPYRPRLKTQLAGDGVVGNADFNTNYDNLEILSQTIYPKIIGNAMRSDIKQYSDMQTIDFAKHAVDSLTDWIRNKRDKNFVTALSNDFTNVVVCDATNGFKDTTAEPSVESATKKIAKGDVCNVKALRQAIFMARSGINYKGKEAFPIKPIRSETITEGGISYQHHSYIILLDTYAINQLKNDPEWIEMQKFAGIRGDENRIFSGIVGLIDGCPVLDMGVWSSGQVGFLNSEVSDSEFYANINKQNHTTLTPPSYYAGGQAVCIGALIGASALVMAGSNSVNFYIDEAQDAGRKMVCGCDRLLAIAKGRFESADGSLSPYSNTDFATIGIFSSKE